jgi:hypothetical protein
MTKIKKMNELNLNDLKNELISRRELLKESDYLFFDTLFNDSDKLLNNVENLSVLLNGLSNTALEFSYTSELLELIRLFEAKIGTKKFIEIIFNNVLVVTPHAKLWYNHLLEDCKKNIHTLDESLVIEMINKLNSDSKKALAECLKELKNHKDYYINNNNLKIIYSMLDIEK